MIIKLYKHLTAVWLVFFYSEKRILALQSGAGAGGKYSGTPGVRSWDTTKMLHLGKTEILKCTV